MPDLIEAGAAALISEELFEEVLRVNDALMRTLEAEKVRPHSTFHTPHSTRVCA